MSITTLPVELLDAICEPLATDPSTLSSLALTSTAVNPSVTRLLYRTLSVSTHARNLPVVGTLAARPALARLVHTFSITLDEAETALHPLYKQLQTALRRMPQLASLELLVDTHASWMLPGVDCDLEYRCLEHFACSFPLDAHLSAFLGRLPSLRSLQLSAPAPPNTSLLPSSYIPLLESYTGPGSLLPLLSPRPLTTLHLSGDLTAVDIPGTSGALPVGEPPPDFYETANWLASPDGETKDNKDAVAQVQVLSAITSAPPAQLLEALARAYPKLVCLRLMTTCAFWEAPDMVRSLLLLTLLDAMLILLVPVLTDSLRTHLCGARVPPCPCLVRTFRYALGGAPEVLAVCRRAWVHREGMGLTACDSACGRVPRRTGGQERSRFRIGRGVHGMVVLIPI
ncbi:hypothetical protein AcW1_004534 [Taiwanofungus camphoratus]|nr:hypothetical protein AcV5_000916 [Antrodia cinnamomea]KAI0959820.1 hypothetical protein AcW1_004534 [Antrodia cinnamomea]